MAAVAVLKIGQGFGTWLIPVIIFGVLGSVAVVSLITLVCICSCRPRRRIEDQEPGMTYETYRTPTIPYNNPSSDRPVDPTIGRLITHSRSLHIPRKQLINGHRLRPQVSSPELRNTSKPPPYAYRTMPSPSPYRNPRPYGQVYFDQIVDPGYPRHVPQQPQRLPPPPGGLTAQPERPFSVSSPSSYSSSCLSSEAPASPEAFSLSSTPPIFSQESPAPVRAPSWVDFPELRGLNSDSDDPPAPSSHNDPSAMSAFSDPYESEKFPTARPRHRSETDGQTGRSWQNNRRLIIVDNNFVRTDARVTAADSTVDGEEANKTREAQVEEPPPAGHKKDRKVVFKVICPDTSDLWKMPVIPGETLEGFADRVKQRTGGDVILFMDDEILASEEDWRAARGGGRIVARLIR